MTAELSLADSIWKQILRELDGYVCAWTENFPSSGLDNGTWCCKIEVVLYTLTLIIITAAKERVYICFSPALGAIIRFRPQIHRVPVRTVDITVSFPLLIWNSTPTTIQSCPCSGKIMHHP